jgi:hypothetical protein
MMPPHCGTMKIHSFNLANRSKRQPDEKLRILIKACRTGYAGHVKARFYPDGKRFGSVPYV